MINLKSHVALLAAFPLSSALAGLSAAEQAVPIRWGDWPLWGDQKDGTCRNPVLPGDYSDLDCFRVGDATPWWQIDLGTARKIAATEIYSVEPAAGHAYKLESSIDDKTWAPYGGRTELTLRSRPPGAGLAYRVGLVDFHAFQRFSPVSPVRLLAC